MNTVEKIKVVRNPISNYLICKRDSNKSTLDKNIEVPKNTLYYNVKLGRYMFDN